MRHGGYRWSDPTTAVSSAMSVNVAEREFDVLRLLAHPRLTDNPINAWEMSVLLRWTIVSLSPRIAPLRRKNMIEKSGRRPGPPPAFKIQDAYVITPRGRAFLAAVKAGTIVKS